MVINQLKQSIGIFLFVTLCPIAGAFGAQSAQEMQEQLDAANLRQSAANTEYFKTPLTTFNRYLDRIEAIDFPAVLACLTDKAKSTQFETTNFTEQEIQQIRSKIQSDAFSAGTLVSFLYSNVDEKAKIIARISATKGSITSVEEIVMILVDTPVGWIIDELDIDEIRN